MTKPRSLESWHLPALFGIGYWRRLRGPWSGVQIGLTLSACVLTTCAGLIAGQSLAVGDRVAPGVAIGGVEVGGWTRQRLLQHLNAEALQLAQQVLRLRVGDQDFALPLVDLGAVLVTEDMLDAALAVGQGHGSYARLGAAVGLGARVDIPNVVTLDEARVETELAAMEQEALQLPLEGQVRVVGGRAKAESPRAGLAIRRSSAFDALQSALARPNGVVVLELDSISPQTHDAGVARAKQRAEKLLQGPLRLTPRVLGEVSSTAERAAAPELAELVVDKSVLAAGLRSAPDREHPGELRLFFEPDALHVVLDEAKRRWTRAPKSALVQVHRGNRFEVVPHLRGTTIATEDFLASVWAAANADERRAELAIRPGEEPRITTDVASGLGLAGKVAEFVTYHPCCRPRVKNIHRIAELIDGTIVLPGETFSLNDAIGERRSGTGFVPAPTIVRGEIQDTVGGGISQFATTIYNAVFDGGYEIIERQPHSYYFTRYPLGHEATVSFPKPDFIFRNDTAAGLLIKTQFGPTYIKVILYGDNGGRVVKREVSARHDFVDMPVEYEADVDVEPGDEVVAEAGDRGFTVDVARQLTYPDGTTTRQARQVIYKARTRVVRRHPCELPSDHPDYSSTPCPEPSEGDAGVAL